MYGGMSVPMRALNSLLATAPLAAVAGAGLFTLLLQSAVLGAYFLTGLVSELLNAALKVSFVSLLGATAAGRPRGAVPAGSCAALPGLPELARGGMPSGHAQCMGALAGFFSMHLLWIRRERKGRCGVSEDTFALAVCGVLVAWVLALAVALQRTGFGDTAAACHTPAQVAVGLLVGAAVGSAGATAFNCAQPRPGRPGPV